MKKIIYTIVFVLILHCIRLGGMIEDCMSQWVQVPNGMGTDKFVTSFTINGNNIFAGTNTYGVYLSTNDGTSWAQTSLNNKEIRALAISGNNILAGCYYYQGVFLSTNNGITWTQTALNNQSVISFATSGNNIFAGTFGNGVYRSTNNGQIWTQTGLNNQFILSLAISGNRIFAGCSNSQGVFLSVDNGLGWTPIGPINKSVSSLAINGNNIFAGTEYYGVYLSPNNGQTWTQTALNNQTVYSLAVSGNNIFAGCNYPSGVYISTNNGQAWIQKNQGWNVIPNVYALLIANNYILTGTDGYSVWRRSLAEIIGIQNISTEIPLAFSLEQNYPNPFNPTTKIKFDVVRVGDVKIVVYDVMGREVQTLVNESLAPGTYETSFDASQLTSGVYFYKLSVHQGGSTTGDFSETKKMLLIK
jgi:hypothetical protein